MEPWNSQFYDKVNDLVEVIKKFLYASNTRDACQILEQHPELLSEETDSILYAFSKGIQSDEIIELIKNRRSFLSLCREVGVAQAFVEIPRYSESSEKLQIILKEIGGLSKPQDMPRRIILLQQALSLVQRQTNPRLWAGLQKDLGASMYLNSYRNLGSDIEQAIEHCNKALEVFTYQDFPMEWADVQNNLAATFSNRIHGNKAENIEKTIQHFIQSLAVFTQKNFPSRWAMAQNNLANAYCERIRGDKAENIEKAIECCNKALGVYTCQNFPVDWAKTHSNLGSAYDDRIRGDRAENIEKTIEHYNQALTVRNQKNFPVDWAHTQNSMGNAYSHRIRGDRAENIEKAIEYYNQALTIRVLGDFPIDWAETQNNIAVTYVDRILGNRAENIEKAIEHYNQALIVWNQKDLPVNWASIQNNLAIAYRNRIWGNIAENIEKAIEHYNQALTVRNQKDFPVDWAETQNNLASTYRNRILGNIAENIEKAIEHYNQALEVFTQENFPIEWAMIQSNLAVAYIYRIRGNRAENIEKAIEHNKQALIVRTLQASPINWAETQNNLAVAYNNRIRGDKAENIEKAIEYCNQALKVRTQKNFPMEWALTQNNLAVIYNNRIRGDRAENKEMAIEHYKQILQVRTQKDFPVDWAITQTNLATAYCDRIRGNRAENIEKAIEHYNNALAVQTRQAFPVDWAGIQNNLASIYPHRIRGGIAENTEKAIEHYNLALEVFTQSNFPVRWAMTHKNLAGTYLNRVCGNRAENIEKAIEHYNNALSVRTRQAFPVDWAGIQNNLAVAYFRRIQGDKTENVEKAISYCHSALEIYKLGSMPDDFRRVCSFLGGLYLDICQWKDAMESCKDAIKAGDLLYRSGLSADSKAVEAKENADIYQNASFAACNLGLTKESLLTLERGKVRLLSEALRLKMKQPKGTPKDQWIKYEQAAEKYRVTIMVSDNKEDYAQWEKDIQKVLEELDSAIQVIQRYNPEFQKELGISEILPTLDSETALLTFCITEKGSIGLAVSKLNGIESVDIPDFKKEDLKNLLVKPNERKFGGWIGDYLSYLNAVDIKAHWNAFQLWQRTLDDVLSIISSNLLGPLVNKLPSQIKRLIILPSGGLFLLPLHAVPLSDGQPLCQHYCISYAPSIELLRQMQSKAKTVEGRGLYAVINPQEDSSLVFSGCEGQAISKLFQHHQVDVGEIGTRATVLDRIPGHAYLHFSCHGSYDWDDPSQSGLYLFDRRKLSLADLQSDVVDMSSARLITLSACETGITDIIKGSAGEFVGLPAGFMLAGVPCVVSSLWSVLDISTALLMERFYSNHIVEGMGIPQALQDAQLWVRDLTAKQVVDYVEKCYRSSKWEGKSKELIEQYRENYLKMAEKFPEEKPFHHPYYWAAFTVNGV